MASDVDIEYLDQGDVERLRPLWLELLAHHTDVSAAALPGPVSPDLSWQRRRSA